MTIRNLLQKRCVPCEGGMPPATDAEIASLLPQVPGWAVRETILDGKTVKTLIHRFHFENFRESMAFLRKVETVAENEGHHPDFSVHYNVVDMTLYTHAIGGLHENDFILAAKINAL